jgi:hypothetical protein
MVTMIVIALVIGHVSQNWIVRRSRRGAAPPSHSSCARCGDEGLISPRHPPTENPAFGTASSACGPAVSRSACTPLPPGRPTDIDERNQPNSAMNRARSCRRFFSRAD